MDDGGIVLYGASGHGLVVADILELTEKGSLCFWDDKGELPEFRYPVTLPDREERNVRCIITVGNNRTRERLAKQIPLRFITALHPAAVIARSVKIGNGTVVMAGAVLNPGVRIGEHCIVNTSATVDHECILENFVHISPGVHLAGEVYVGEGAHIGIGSCVVQGITIGKWATVGAGAVVIRNVPDYAVVAGVPADIIKYHPSPA